MYMHVHCMHTHTSIQATVLSSNRSFVRRLELLDVGNPSKSAKGGDPIVMFIFTDSVEVRTYKLYL